MSAELRSFGTKAFGFVAEDTVRGAAQRQARRASGTRARKTVGPGVASETQDVTFEYGEAIRTFTGLGGARTGTAPGASSSSADASRRPIRSTMQPLRLRTISPRNSRTPAPRRRAPPPPNRRASLRPASVRGRSGERESRRDLLPATQIRNQRSLDLGTTKPKRKGKKRLGGEPPPTPHPPTRTNQARRPNRRRWLAALASPAPPAQAVLFAGLWPGSERTAPSVSV